jgi:DNA-binding transcriptional LysR family regulator
LTEGDGVAMGALPHFLQVLRDGRLCAPFGRQAVAYRGDFFIVIRRDVAGDDAVEAFVKWLRSEVRRDDEGARDRSPAPSDARARKRRP